MVRHYKKLEINENRYKLIHKDNQLKISNDTKLRLFFVFWLIIMVNCGIIHININYYVFIMNVN